MCQRRYPSTHPPRPRAVFSASALQACLISDCPLGEHTTTTQNTARKNETQLLFTFFIFFIFFSKLFLLDLAQPCGWRSFALGTVHKGRRLHLDSSHVHMKSPRRMNESMNEKYRNKLLMLMPSFSCSVNNYTAAALRDTDDWDLISLADRRSAPFALTHSRSPSSPLSKSPSHPPPHPIPFNLLDFRRLKLVHVAGTSRRNSAAAPMPVIGGGSQPLRAAESRSAEGKFASQLANGNALLINAGQGGRGLSPVPVPGLRAFAKGGSLLAEFVVVSSDLDSRQAVDTIIPDADAVDVLSTCLPFFVPSPLPPSTGSIRPHVMWLVVVVVSVSALLT